MRSMFAGDQYQNTIDDIFYERVEMDVEFLTVNWKGNQELLVCFYVCDIVHDEDSEILRNKDAMKTMDNSIPIQNNASCFLSNECSMRYLKKVAYREGSSDYAC